MTKLILSIFLFVLFSGCSQLENELTDLEPNLFAADAPPPFVKTSVERASEGIFIYDIRINFTSIYESLGDLQKGLITDIRVDDRFIPDPAQQFFIVRDVQSGTTICRDVSFVASNGQSSRIVEICHDVD